MAAPAKPQVLTSASQAQTAPSQLEVQPGGKLTPEMFPKHVRVDVDANTRADIVHGTEQIAAKTAARTGDKQDAEFPYDPKETSRQALERVVKDGDVSAAIKQAKSTMDYWTIGGIKIDKSAEPQNTANNKPLRTAAEISVEEKRKLNDPDFATQAIGRPVKDFATSKTSKQTPETPQPEPPTAEAAEPEAASEPPVQPETPEAATADADTTTPKPSTEAKVQPEPDESASSTDDILSYSERLENDIVMNEAMKFYADQDNLIGFINAFVAKHARGPAGARYAVIAINRMIKDGAVKNNIIASTLTKLEAAASQDPNALARKLQGTGLNPEEFQGLDDAALLEALNAKFTGDIKKDQLASLNLFIQRLTGHTVDRLNLQTMAQNASLSEKQFTNLRSAYEDLQKTLLQKGKEAALQKTGTFLTLLLILMGSIQIIEQTASSGSQQGQA